MSAVKGEPILIPCEGSGCPSAAGPALVRLWICRMCGQRVGLTSDGLIAQHQRDDILARIERGDFG